MENSNQSSEKQVLVIGHSFVVDANRALWNALAKKEDVQVDMVVPKHWTSNLIKDLYYQFNQKTDGHLREVFPINVFYKGNGSFFTFSPWPLWKVLRGKKYDAIVLAQETWSFSLAETLLISLFSKNRGTPFYLWVCQNLKKQHLFWLRFLERIFTVNTTAILCCCSEIQEVIEWKGINVPCRYFPFSFDDETYDFDPSPLQRDKIRLGYLGRLSDEKGIDLLIQAFQELRQSDSNLELVIGGGGPMASQFESMEGVVFKGILPHAEAHLFYQDIDIFVLPSKTTSFWKEQFGRVIIETLASGRPIVGSSSGAIPEVMGHLKVPYVFEEQNLESLKEKIKLAIDDIKEQKVDPIVKEGRERAFKLYSHAGVADRFYRYAFKSDLWGLIEKGHCSSVE
jgi:glycosyltransferase involved in cell wall biosynthesis